MSSKVLIIDDDPEVLQTAAELLRRAGFAVVTYEGKLNRLNFIAQERPDLVLLDVNMPFLPGDELLRLLKSYPLLREIPVLLFSSNDERDLRLMVLETGAAGYVSKSELGGDFAARITREFERIQRSS
jgi:DNA-binding response OmpR family regulator